MMPLLARNCCWWSSVLHILPAIGNFVYHDRKALRHHYNLRDDPLHDAFAVCVLPFTKMLCRTYQVCHDECVMSKVVNCLGPFLY